LIVLRLYEMLLKPDESLRCQGLLDELSRYQ
jgi:hypothetical protein